MDIMIDGVVSTKLGLASHQNAAPLVRQLTVLNNHDEDLADLILELEPSLPFAVPKKWHIDRMAKFSTIQISDRDIALKEGYLAGLTEGMKASVLLRLISGDEVLTERAFPVDLLARNEWGGARSMPELLAAFCTPNDPAVDKILKGASDVLRRAGRPDGIDGYTAKSRQRVWELTSAIWSAVCGYQISYTLPPASFELEGQKIRTPHQILDARLGTCLDTALLFASAMEQASLNAIVILTKGHAFTGVWLQPQEFAQILNEDVSALRKRIELQELLVFETTLATKSPAPGFSHAIDVARRQLTDEDFVMALDLHRARMQKLRPLTAQVQKSPEQQGDQPTKVSEALEAAPALPGFDVETEEVPDTPAGKLVLWQRKLLDLTTRNRLLHLPDRSKVVRLVCTDPAGLEDILADNKSVRIIPMPEFEVGGRDSQIYEQRNQESLEQEFGRQAMARSEVPCRMEKEQLDAALIELYRKARLDLEEGGSNTLFLAIGFLRWKKDKDDPKTYYAPLILLPVKLERRSALSGVKMWMLDDEPRFNLTLLELLRHDFQLNIQGLNGDLPKDESGIDVNGIWNIVRHAVRDIPGFEVTTDVVLGTFSFAKYLMWRDLVDRTDQLAQHDVVRHLLRYKLGDSSLKQNGQFPEPHNLDELIAPSELFTPLPADSSQLAAVVASANGHNFVLDGPPGTGKSQTIANMIAHNLALGRRVLFVAEKMAALDVVKRRLEDKGIGQFCLELHSNKSSKLHVLQQLDRAWTTRDTLTEEDWSRQAEKVRVLRDRLNRVVSVLHKRWSNGWSIHEAIGRVIRDASPSTPRLSWPSDTEHDQTQIDHLRDVARRLDLNRPAAITVGIYITLLAQTEWSNAWQEAMVASSRLVLMSLSACDNACAKVIESTGLRLGGSTSIAAKLLQFARLLPNAYGLDLRFAFSPSANTIQSSAQQAIALLSDYESLERQLSQAYAPECIRRIDVKGLKDDLSEADRKFWIFSTLARKKIAKSLGAIAGTPATPNAEADLPRLEAMKDLVAKLDTFDHSLRDIPGWSGLRTDVTRIRVTLKLAESLRSSLSQLAATPEQLISLKQEAQRLIIEGNELLNPDGVIAHAVSHLTQSYKALFDATGQFAKVAGSEIDLNTQIPDLYSNARSVLEQEASLNALCSWRRTRNDALASGLLPLVESIERGTLNDHSIPDVLEVAYARWFAAKSIDAEPLLRNFVPAEHQSDIQAYTKAVDELDTLTTAYIRAKLSGTIPDKNDISKRSGFGILKHELQKSRQHKPVRQLAQEMGEAFTILAPCMLMSPLSIAQYLPANHELFDLVIFDEASQITPWDAIGAIARGKQVVVAGDPRQMPPTSFFNRGASSDEDDTEEDLESVLDECIGSGVPQHGLTWHYRSRHESLITFSNYRYYDGDLITFPAADTRPSAVTWRRIDGVYSRGKGRCNQIEAKAIVDEVVKRLTDQNFVATGQSIGIITLNAEQQQLVEDLLDQARRQHPAIEPFFKDELAEPVVVKNLETMQGDERDLIILGIGFGPTEPGAQVMSMNFGPLNREGGWRRLNVAVTRARQEMIVFTSFDPSMIDFNRTGARAVHDLRHFIEFADQGPKAITAAVHGSRGTYESPFERYVAEGLRAKGWETHPQIGVSRYRIDLGVVHPDRPGDYLIGVECDGASYHSAATARDRDKVRSEILRGLGWHLLRVWSTEWWVDREGALERLHVAITGHLDKSRTEAMTKEKERSARHTDQTSEISPKDTVLAQVSLAAPNEENGVIQNGASAANQELPKASMMKLVARGPTECVGEPVHRIYQKADLAEFEPLLKPELFQEAGYNTVLQALIKRVLEHEAPILDTLLVDRVARAHGFKRSGRLIRDRVLSLAESHYHLQEDGASDQLRFVWLNKDEPDRWNCYRVPNNEEDIRFIEEISSEELAAAARAIKGDDHPIEIARAFQIRRLSSAARDRIIQILGNAQDSQE